MTTTPYPVDSTTRICCGGIGRHTRECTTSVVGPQWHIAPMTTTTEHYPDYGPPLGAEADVWDDTGRDIYQLSATVLASNDFMKCPLVSAMARQRL
ncbi:hypothetical protein BH09ACT8_BH09ACT8_45880 [soil metagenome]